MWHEKDAGVHVERVGVVWMRRSMGPPLHPYGLTAKEVRDHPEANIPLYLHTHAALGTAVKLRRRRLQELEHLGVHPSHLSEHVCIQLPPAQLPPNQKAYSEPAQNQIM